jgi:hypothetical protein
VDGLLRASHALPRRRGGTFALTAALAFLLAAACAEPDVRAPQGSLQPEQFVEDVWETQWNVPVDDERRAGVRQDAERAAAWDRSCVSWFDSGDASPGAHASAVLRQSSAAQLLDPGAIACELASLGDILRSGDRQSGERALYEGVYMTTAYAGLLAGLDLVEELALACEQSTDPAIVRTSINLARRRIVEAVAVAAAPPELIEAAKARDLELLPVCGVAS